MREIKEQVKGGPVYLSFDIDGLDPSCRAGTGTPEIGGLTTIQGIGDHPRLPGPADRRLRPGRGGAALRFQRQHLAARLQPPVRDAVRAARA
jgi:hypothetical protein